MPLLFSTFWLILIPIILGFGILSLIEKKDKKPVALALIAGLFFEFVVFQFLAIPMTFLKFSFNSLKNTWLILIIASVIYSIKINKNDFKNIILENIKEIKELPKILTMIFVILLGFQCYVGFFYIHEDYDDSNFVAKATIAYDTNTLFVYNDIGTEYNAFPTRTVLSQFPHFTATIAKLSGTHPAIVAHTIFPVIFVIVAYTVYYTFALSLFKNNKNKVMIFLNILSIIYIFGDYTRYAIFDRLLYRVWQGKSILANVSIPLIWYIYIEYIGKEKEKIGWVLLLLILWGSVLLSSMALVLPMIMVAILTGIFCIKDKNIKYIRNIVICCIPCIIYGCIYVGIKDPNKLSDFSVINTNNMLVAVERKFDVATKDISRLSNAIANISQDNTEENVIVLDNKKTEAENELSKKVKAFWNEVKSENNLDLVKQSYKSASGTGFHMMLFFLSMIFIIYFCWKDKKEIAIVFSINSIIILLINLNPIFTRIYAKLLGWAVHWRVYWMLPIGISIAYSVTEILHLTKNNKIKVLIAIVAIILIIISGKFVYTEKNFAKIDNYYKVPDLLLEMIFTISSDENEYKKVAGPEEVSVYTRQIDGTIKLAQIRNVTGVYNDDSIVTIINSGNSEKIYNEAVEKKCNYIIMNKATINKQNDLTSYGGEILCENAKYVLYKINLEKEEE